MWITVVCDGSVYLMDCLFPFYSLSFFLFPALVSRGATNTFTCPVPWMTSLLCLECRGTVYLNVSLDGLVCTWLTRQQRIVQEMKPTMDSFGLHPVEDAIAFEGGQYWIQRHLISLKWFL